MNETITELRRVARAARTAARAKYGVHGAQRGCCAEDLVADEAYRELRAMWRGRPVDAERVAILLHPALHRDADA